MLYALTVPVMTFGIRAMTIITGPIPTPAIPLLDAGAVISDGSGWMIYLIGGLLGFVSLGLGVYYAFRVAKGVKKLGKG